ncbi:MAG: hypothetical protein RL648_779 [Verrucomicrobiota bacterium]
MLQWKGVLPAGTTFPHPVTSLDILGTIAALAGAEPDPSSPLEGVNLVSHLTNPDLPHAHKCSVNGDRIQLNRAFVGGAEAESA